VALVTLALVLRLGFVGATSEYTPAGDAADYDLHAAYIVSQGVYPPTRYATPGSPSAFRPPGWPHFMAGVYEVTGKRWNAARTASAFLGAAAVLLIFLIGEAAMGRRAGLAAGWIAAVYPPFVFLSGALISENLFVPLVLGAVYAAMRGGRSPHRIRWALAAGALCGLAALTRTNGLLVLLPVAIALLPRERPRLSPRALAAPGLAAIAAALAIAPWTIRNAAAFGELVPVSTQSGYTLAGAYNAESAADGPARAATRIPAALPELRDLFRAADMDEPELDGELRDRALDFAVDRPRHVLTALRLNSLRQFGLAGDPSFTDAWNRERDLTDARRALAGAGLLAVLILVLVALARRPGRATVRAAPLWLWLVPLLLFASTAPILGNPRYRLAVDPFLILAAGAAFATDVAARRGVRVP
jgi:4-amino-4-deoxy-L-arabinose transferase-like glycosyltransferase